MGSLSSCISLGRAFNITDKELLHELWLFAEVYDFFRRYFCMSSTIAVDSEIEFVANPIAANTKIENDNEIEINNEVHEIEFVNNPMAANTNMENDNEKEINYEVEKTKVDSTQA